MSATYDLIVVGEGFAGLTCASEATRLGLKVATFEAEFFGGLVVNVNELEHFEEADGLSGMDYAGSLASRNKKAGVRSVSESVNAIRSVGEGFEVQTDSGAHTARFVVIASGARLKKLGVPGETEFEGRGVSHCADCDAPMFTDTEVIVAGGGDWALQDALLLACECSAVHLVHEGPVLSACPEYIERVKSEPKIRLHPAQSIEAVVGNDTGMTGVRTRDAQGRVSEIRAAGLFSLVGLEPNSGLAPAEAGRDQNGYLVVGQDLQTPVSGLWAIGQVRSGFSGWLKDAVAEGRRAAELVKAKAG
jgi:thioredoxin reductase (NADPH)